MIVFIAADGQLRLQDSDNFGAFSVVEELPGSAAERLADIAIPAEDNHYWLDAGAVIELSGRAADAGWVQAFWDMLAQVERYGYADLAKQRVKAHLESNS